jgi:hypothetical protein
MRRSSQVSSVRAWRGNDLGKETVMTDITAWIEARLPGGAKSGADD